MSLNKKYTTEDLRFAQKMYEIARKEEVPQAVIDDIEALCHWLAERLYEYEGVAA